MWDAGVLPGSRDSKGRHEEPISIATELVTEAQADDKGILAALHRMP